VFFLKKTITNSVCQFKADFGEYPPKPLLPMKLKNQFHVLCMGQVRVLFQQLGFIFHVMGEIPPSNNPPLIRARKRILKIKAIWIKTIASLKNSPFQVKFVLFVVFLIVFSPLLLLFIVFLGIKILIGTIRSPIYNSVGYFQVLPNIPSQIVVNTTSLKRAKKDIDHSNENIISRERIREGITSHEHIHLLQENYFPGRVMDYFVSEKGIFLKSLLINPERDFDFCSYHFNPSEMEARLHEVVLSFYREYGELPSDKAGFIKLLFKSREINKIRVSIARQNKGCNRPYPERRFFDVRCYFMQEEMLTAILKLKHPFMLDFLLNVLSVMYGNLLIVYGDTNRAEKYFDTVSSFDFYNELYGEIIIPA
jgi:hypothetical protein